MIYFFFYQLGNPNKIDILRKQRCCRMWKHLLWNKNLCLLRAQFLLKNKHHRPSKKEEKLPADTCSHWLMMLSWPAASEMTVRKQIGQVLSNKIPFKKEKKSQNSRNRIWSWWNIVVGVHSLKHKMGSCLGLIPRTSTRLEGHQATLPMCGIMYWEIHGNQRVVSLSYWIIPANTDLSKELYTAEVQWDGSMGLSIVRVMKH